MVGEIRNLGKHEPNNPNVHNPKSLFVRHFETAWECETIKKEIRADLHDINLSGANFD